MKIQNLEELRLWVHKIFLPYKNKNLVVLLEGDLGAGKTQLVKFACSLLNIENVVSPTFSIIQEYPQVYHCDLYRIQTHEELEEMGFYEIFKSGWVFVEWPQIMDLKRIPKNFEIIKIQISKKDSDRFIYLEVLC